ncbi:MAG TPA: phosphopyruvate hydratase [Firmicutes bacterium]|nr:phosphopyruvate hydratase [Bacillota bacterium]
MGSDSKIVSVTAREVFSLRVHPGVEVTVVTQNGAAGVAIATAGTSVGEQEARFVYDENKRLLGRGVQKAVDNVNNIIGPALKGMDATKQLEIDEVLINLDGTPNKSKLGANATGSVSAAVLKAGAASLGIPLYQHIGGINAYTLPVPGVLTIMGPHRYGGGERAGTKPTYSIMCYGFDSFREASYAGWRAFAEFIRILNLKLNLNFSLESYGRVIINSKVVEHDREFWDIMAETITNLGYEGRMGIQVDVAASTYFDKEKQRYVGLFSAEDKTREDLIELYKEMVKSYPFVIIEDPLEENDFEGHAYLTKELGIEIVGDDLFATNIDRVKRAAELGAANAVLLKVYQKGTISEAFDMVKFAYQHGYGVMPCSSRGEGADIADYAVGLNTGHLREGAIDETGNRLLKIESELGSRARFLGKEGLKLGRSVKASNERL